MRPNHPRSATTPRKDHAMANHRVQYLFQLHEQAKGEQLLFQMYERVRERTLEVYVYLNNTCHQKLTTPKAHRRSTGYVSYENFQSTRSGLFSCIHNLCSLFLCWEHCLFPCRISISILILYSFNILKIVRIRRILFKGRVNCNDAQVPPTV